ncbi:MAG: hypothetical protein K9H64_21420 [Bacteroidales bacterium]|nr:hypothetical protein [Bacteroidales bacterium]MCF8458601.1 hypothetical protein [Bacteroidales bacterium]
MKAYIIMFIMLLCFIHTAFGQKLKYEFIEGNPRTPNGLPYLSKINFIDTISNEVISTFDVFENNPYLNLEAPTINYSGDSVRGHNRNYDVSSYNFDSEIFSELKETVDLKSMKGIGCSIDTTSSKGEFFALIYYLGMYDTNGVSKKDYSIATIYVFNKYGKIINKIKNLNIDCRLPEISQDGKYLVCQYMSGAWGTEIIEEGFQILDLHSNNIVYSKEGRVLSITYYQGYSYIGIEKGQHVFDKYLLDSSNDLLLMRTIDWSNGSVTNVKELFKDTVQILKR